MVCLSQLLCVEYLYQFSPISNQLQNQFPLQPEIAYSSNFLRHTGIHQMTRTVENIEIWNGWQYFATLILEDINVHVPAKYGQSTKIILNYALLHLKWRMGRYVMHSILLTKLFLFNKAVAILNLMRIHDISLWSLCS